jgi:hypothetical protein
MMKRLVGDDSIKWVGGLAVLVVFGAIAAVALVAVRSLLG